MLPVRKPAGEQTIELIGVFLQNFVAWKPAIVALFVECFGAEIKCRISIYTREAVNKIYVSMIFKRVRQIINKSLNDLIPCFWQIGIVGNNFYVRKNAENRLHDLLAPFFNLGAYLGLGAD